MRLYPSILCDDSGLRPGSGHHCPEPPLSLAWGGKTRQEAASQPGDRTDAGATVTVCNEVKRLARGGRTQITSRGPASGSMRAAVTDALYRAAYRAAYPLWRCYLDLFRPRTRGAQVALWSGDRVLLVRNSYRRNYVFPGGFIRDGEDTAAAASRELYEETGVKVPAERLGFSFAWPERGGESEAHDDIYECILEERPLLSIDNREVVEARFMTPRCALALPLEQHVRHYLSTVY